MFRRARKVRIYVRNKQRYDPASKTRGFLYVDVENYVGTTIADIKEDIRKQTKGAVRIDELFLNNLPLADDRSVAHYNLQNETILETTSNPFWVSCLYIKVAEVKQEQEGHPNNEEIQKWTSKSIPKKYTLIGILLNSKKEKFKQPPHFPTLDDFLLYLEGLNNKKGASMHPEYTQKDMRAFEREYRQDFLGNYEDPLSVFLDHHALRLGYLEPEDIDQPARHVEVQPLINIDSNRIPQNNGRQRQGRLCEDCEIAIASLYCTDCPEGIALCEPCSDRLHAGVKRRRHNLQDIRQAPKNNKPYVPRAFLAPFALTVAMYRNKVAGNRKICLIIDEHERDKDRLLSFATDKRIDAQVRFLPAGDYVWILSPPMYDVTERYLGNDPDNEIVLPFIVERKSWEDYENTLNSPRFQRQINNMLGSGLKYCYYLMEGSLSALKSNKSQHHQQHLKAQVEKLITEYGFYVNYTSSWMKSAQWLLWFSQLLIKGSNMGLFKDDGISYSEFSSRVARQTGSSKLCTAFRNAEKCYHKWTAQFFIDHIFRDSQGGQSMIDMVREELNVSERKKHLFVIQDLEQYNKKRQQSLSKCCEMVCSNTQNARETVSTKIGLSIHNMVHYDLSSFWQLNIQIMLGVYVVRTENDEDSTKIQQKFLAGPQGPIPTLSPSKVKKGVISKKMRKRNQEKQQCNIVHANILREIPNNQSNIASLPAEGTSSHRDDLGADGSFMRTVSSPANNSSFRKVPGSRKSNILTFSSTECSEDAYKTLDGSTSLIEKSGNEISSHPKTFSGIPLHMVTPFSGEGHCLGSRTGTNSHLNNNNSMMEHNPELVETFRPGNSHGGLLGGANETVDRDPPDVSIKTEDYFSSQDEEDILRKIMEKSKSDIASHNNNNEDEMVRLAVELSKKDSSGMGGEDEQLRLALERSMTETFMETDYINDNNQPIAEEELEMAIERSKRNCSNNADKLDTNRFNNNVPYQPTVEEEYEQAIERSKQEFEYKASGSYRGPMDDNLTSTDTYQTTADEELEMVIERSKIEISQSPYRSYKLVESKSAQFEDPRNISVKEGGSGNFNSRQACELNMYEVIDGNDKGMKRNISDVNESGIAITSENRDCSEEEQLEIAIKLSKQYSSQDSKCRSNLQLQQIQSAGQNVTEKERSSDLSNLDMEDAQLKLAIERSRFENYSPRKRLKSGNESRTNTKTESVDKRNRKSESKECVEVILIDSQSQEVEEDYESDHISSTKSENSYSKPFKNNKYGVVDKKLIKNSCGLERVSLYQSTLLPLNGCKLSTHKNYDQDTYKDSACMLLDARNHLLDDISVNVLNSCENNVTKCKVTDLTSNGYNDDNGDNDDDNDDCVLPSPDKVSAPGLKLTPPLSQRKRSLFNLSNQFSSPEIVVNRHSENDAKIVKETMQPSHEKSFTYPHTVVSDNENNDSHKLPKKNNLLSQVFYDSSEGENQSSDDDENDNGDENKMISESKDCDLKRDSHDDGRILIPGNIFITSNSQIKGKSSQKEEPFKCNEDKCMFNRTQNNSAINVPVDLEICNNTSCLNEVEGEEVKSESLNNEYDKLPDHCEDHKTLIDQLNDHEKSADHDDDMLDIDFQPNSQDYDTERSGASDDASGPDLDDVETLPVIGRPRIVKYKKVKSKIDSLVKEKLNKKDRKGNQDFKYSLKSIKTEKGSDIDNGKSAKLHSVDMDEQIARLMQSQFDSELINRNKNLSKVSDEEYARKLQDRFNNNAELDTKPESSTSKSMNTSSDETYAKQLDLVLNGEKRETDRIQNLCSSTENVCSRNDHGSDREREIEELQRKELEKIECWKKAILDDEKLARQLQQLEEIEREHAAEANSSGITSPFSSQCKTMKTETSFKKMVALHKASREKALLQLNEYRQLQMDRFRTSRNFTNAGHHTATVTSTGVISLVDDEPVTATHQNMQNSVITIDDEIPGRHIDGNMTRNRLSDFPNSFYSPSCNQSKPLVRPGSHVTESDKFIGESQQASSSHVISSDLSQAQMKNSNITCGNCGEKGHNRTYIRCKMYHTAEETARREVKMEKMKQKKEEKKQMEVETLNLLTNHQQVLEEMTEQIQNEMNTIQCRLKQKTTELEKQVSHRVKKLENNKKKGKR